MTAALHSLREVMLAGDVLLNTQSRDILASQLTPALADVTATVWNAHTEIWSQHFVERFDEAGILPILALCTENSVV